MARCNIQLNRTHRYYAVVVLSPTTTAALYHVVADDYYRGASNHSLLALSFRWLIDHLTTNYSLPDVPKPRVILLLYSSFVTVLGIVTCHQPRWTCVVDNYEISLTAIITQDPEQFLHDLHDDRTA